MPPETCPSCNKWQKQDEENKEQEYCDWPGKSVGCRPLYWLFGTHRASQTGGQRQAVWATGQRGPGFRAVVLRFQSVRQWCSLDGPRPRVSTTRYEVHSVHYRLIPNLGVSASYQYWQKVPSPCQTNKFTATSRLAWELVGVREASQPQSARPLPTTTTDMYLLVSVQYESCRLFYFPVPGHP